MQSTAAKQKNLEQFLQNHFAKDSYTITPIQGDAGFRSYFRVKLLENRHREGSNHSSWRGSDSDRGHPHLSTLTTTKKLAPNAAPSGSAELPSVSYILMDCPPNYCSIQPFIEIANYLRSHAFSAPEIVAFDIDKGFIILEDFGDMSVKTLIKNAEAQTQKNIYYLIVDLLISLQDKAPPTNLRAYDNELLLSELALFEEWYIPYILKRKLTATESLEYRAIWQEILSNQVPLKESIILRDYHVENLMYLENRPGLNKLGLLDFQDALIGSPIYDLVSVLEDARIDVPRALALDCLSYFAECKKLNLPDVLVNYHILGAQRNSRILGVFARKSIRDKNDNYLQYMPLVLKYLEDDLAHPVMRKLREWTSTIMTKVINAP